MFDKLFFLFYKFKKFILWPLRKHFPVLINRIDDPRSIAVLCEDCGRYVKAKGFHLGFSNQEIFYCSKCESAVLVDAQNPIFQKYSDLQNTPFQNFLRHEIPYWDAISQEFELCDCGGNFHFLNPPRCPICKGLVFGQRYEDKPVLKKMDRYTFISGNLYHEEKLKMK